MIPIVLLAWILNSVNAYIDFPSLMTANASMAVVVDKGFFDNKLEYQSTMRKIHEFIRNVTRTEMGDINVQIFRSTKIIDFRDYTALLSVATCTQTWSLHEIANKEQLVHLAITEQDCPRFPDLEGVSIPLVPSGKELSQLIFDLRSADALLWNNVNVLHDETFDRDTIGRVMKSISASLPNKKFSMVSRALFSFKRAETDYNRTHYIKEMLDGFHVDQLGKCFLVIVTSNGAADIMEIAKALNMVQPDSQWLYIIVDSVAQSSLNISSFTDLLSEGGNVAFAYNATDNDAYCDSSLMCHVQEIVTAVTNSLKLSLMVEIELYNRVSEDEFQHIRLQKHERRQEILKNIRMKLIEDTFVSGGICGKCLLWRFASAITWGNFFLHGKNTAHLIESGTWIPTLGANLTDEIFPHVAHGFRGINLPVATYHNPPWQTISFTDSGEKEYGGLVFDVVKYLGKKLNFTYTVYSPASNRVVRFTRNETEVDVVLTSKTREMPPEIIDMIQSKKVFLAACAYTINDVGRDLINFTIPIFIQTYSFLTAKPGQLSRALLFIAPFSKETWACVLASIIIMSPILYLVHKYSPCSVRSGLNSQWQCIWYVYGALLQQGGMYLPRCDSARLLIGVWWLVVMVIVATYSGSLIAFLTFPNTDVAILTVDDLIEHKGKLTWGFPTGSFLEVYLRNAEEDKYHYLLKKSKIHNATQEADMIKRVKAGKHVLIDWRSTLRFVMRNDLLSTGECSFSLSTDEFMDEPIAMIIPQDSPYVKIINAELHRMHESGLMNKWISEQIPMKDKCSDTTNQEVNERKVNVSDMQGIFFVLFMGVIVAICLLLCEFFWHRYRVSRRRKFIEPFLS